MSLTKHKRNWDTLGEVDPLWVILTDPRRKYGKWNPAEFFATGEKDVEDVMAVASRLGHPSRQETALDFGCGVGRLTRSLARHFRECHGVDISASMIARANELNESVPNCHFVVNDRADLRLFADNYFDLILTLIVLQHLPTRAMIQSYLREFVRVLRPGGLLIFQLPSNIPWRHRIQGRRRLYAVLRGLGFRHRFLYEKLGLTPIVMNFLSEHDVVGLLEALDAQVLQTDSNSSPAAESRTYYVTK